MAATVAVLDAAQLPHHPAADLFPMLPQDELDTLADDIRDNGLLTPIWLYDDPEHGRSVLDGRNRFAACRLAGVEPRFEIYSGDDPIGFALSVNLKRRHLTTGQRAALALEVEPLYAQAARQRQSEAVAERHRREAADRESRNTPTSTEGECLVGADLHQLGRRAPRAADRAASAVGGVSGRAVAQAKRVRDTAPDLHEKVKSGDLALDRADRIVRDREAEEKRRERAAAEVAALDIGTRLDIRHGDFRDVLADLTDVDAIITDPPYPREFLPLLADLAEWSDHVLAPNGVLAVLFGQTYLPEVFRLLDGWRPYRWTACYLTEGAGYRSHAAKVQSNWKPVLIYGGRDRSFADVFRSTGTDADAKDRHRWGQDYGAFHDLVARLTEPGQTVVDPFMGSGTTLQAAAAQGRHAIGCDIDAEAVETAKGWLL